MRYLFLLMLSMVAAVQASEPPSPLLVNQLQGNRSPYLAMHGQDPVAWQEWGPAAFEVARRENRLLFVSVGYFACHWCHVMQRESYQNTDIARLLNEHYVPVKIDRELLPGIDSRLMDFAQRTRGRGGWPLNIFLTPEGYPLLAVLYEPPVRFHSLLDKLEGRWSSDAAELNTLARQAQQALAREFALTTGTTGSVDRSALLAAFVNEAASRADEVSGGFGDQTKFPSTPQLEALLALQQSGEARSLADFLRLTLDHMATQGLRDQLVGGFFRYTVDPNWQVPHFEKMLYDNAQLAYIYLLADEVLEQPHYREIAFDTLDFINSRLQAPEGGYIASLSAVDEAGVEGASYLWSDDKIKTILTPQEQKLVRRFWGLEGSLTTEDGWLPRQMMSLSAAAKAAGVPEEQMRSIRSKMVRDRAARPAPRDNKVLTAWNGLVLRAMAKAAATPGGARFKKTALELARVIQQQMWDGKRLRRSRGDGQVNANLADYAHVAEGFIALYKVTGSPEYADFAEQIVRTGWQQFHTPGGWKLDRDSLLKYGVERVALDDGAQASASAVLLRSALALRESGRLADLSEALDQAREAALSAYSDESSELFWGISHLRM